MAHTHSHSQAAEAHNVFKISNSLSIIFNKNHNNKNVYLFLSRSNHMREKLTICFLPLYSLIFSFFRFVYIIHYSYILFDLVNCWLVSFLICCFVCCVCVYLPSMLLCMYAIWLFVGCARHSYSPTDFKMSHQTMSNQTK